ncbi:MAG: hypothetical protein JST65_03580 [Acidobacteria bacterium]|nr:hypothetical protein [Acidobacteriota bacterium]
MKRIVVFCLFQAFVSLAFADQVALTGWTGGLASSSAGDQLYAWRFDIGGSGVNVTALGVGDYDNNGLSISHDVGIFRVSDQAVLASATLPDGTGTTLLSGFRYLTLTSAISLAPGSYVIVMTMPAFNADWQYIKTNTVTTTSPVTYLDSVLGVGSGLGYPSGGCTGCLNEGIFGPNFQFVVPTTGVPEPSAAALWTASGVASALLLRRRRHRAYIRKVASEQDPQLY